jgi:hypothetical protein
VQDAKVATPRCGVPSPAEIPEIQSPETRIKFVFPKTIFAMLFAHSILDRRNEARYKFDVKGNARAFARFPQDNCHLLRDNLILSTFHT